jgi:hypothetical protein
MARSPKFCLRTKHIIIKYHNCHDSSGNGKVVMCSIDTKEQQADIVTKPLDESLFMYLRKHIMGWCPCYKREGETDTVVVDINSYTELWSDIKRACV